MGVIDWLQYKYYNAKHHLTSNSLDDLIWVVDFVPSAAGFSLLSEKMGSVYWVIHIATLFYIYGAGNLLFLINEAQGALEFIQCYANITIFMLTLTCTYWWMAKKNVLNKVMALVKSNDGLLSKDEHLQKKRGKFMQLVKNMILVFFALVLLSEFVIYLPNRSNVDNNFAMTLCPGVDLTVSPNREICSAVLFVEEFLIMTVVLNYQALFLLLTAHTALMYQLLSDEMILMGKHIEEMIPEEHGTVAKQIDAFIHRHCMILDVARKIRDLYSMPIGINFGLNATLIMMYFFLPFHEAVKFIPVLFYSSLTFFLYCFICQKQIDASEFFQSAVYGCGWEMLRAQERKKLYFMLLQAQQPVLLLAAYIFPVNIATFAATCQGMYKFITVMKF